MTRSLLDSSIKMEFLVSDESSYLFHYPSKIQHATDVDFKSYKRKCSESSEIVVTTIISIYELSLRLSYTNHCQKTKTNKHGISLSLVFLNEDVTFDWSD